MDDLFGEFLSGLVGGLATGIGCGLAKLLFTPQGLVTVLIVGGLGVPTWYYVEIWTPESEAQTAVQSLCRENWNYYRRHRRMPNSASTKRGSSTYGYRIIPTRYSNVVVISASGKKSNLNNFVGIAFGPSGKQKGYACTIYKSNSPSNKSTSPVKSSSGLGGPSGYRLVETLK
ncbi:MAG: hypothetical protein ACRCU2_29305 [Planktothrix sp.]